MGTAVVGENGVQGEQGDDLELNPAQGSIVTCGRTNLAEHSGGAVTR